MWMPHHEEVVHRAGVGLLLGESQRKTAKGFEIAFGDFASARGFGLEGVEKFAKDGGLQIIESGVRSDDVVLVLLALTAVAKLP